MRKSILILIFILVFGLGFSGGYYTGYYKYVKKPQIAAQQQAQKQQEELKRMVRHGTIVSIAPDEITVKVEKGGGDIGENIKAQANQYTAVQIGTGFVNKPGEPTDLTKFFKEGDTIDMLYKDGQILALHRDARPGETQTKPPANQTPQVQK
jgi:hypothetical protein